MTQPPERLPEDEERLHAFRAALRGRESEVVDAVERTRARLAQDDLLLLDHPGVPLRPLFLSHRRLQAVCTALHGNMLALGDHLRQRLGDLEGLEHELPVPRAFLEHVDARAALSDHGRFGLVLRPDGFLYTDRFLLTEPNHANGYLISGTYPDAVHAVFSDSPVFAALGWDVAEHVVRPLDRVIAMLRAQARDVRSPSGRPRVALFWHSGEHAIIKEWNARTQGILRYVPRRLQAAGFDVIYAHEDELDVDAGGTCCFVPDGKPVDVVLMVPIGTFFLYEPTRLSADLRHLRGTHVGHAPFLQPLFNVVVDKGTLPLWQALPCWPRVVDGVRVECIPTHYPHADRAVEYRKQRADWVLKRSFEGKDTHAGVSAPGRTWNRTLTTAMETAEYVMQPYLRMSVAETPVVVDGRVEWRDMSVELSLFIIEGRYAGAFARFLPFADGHVLSPPPPGMGFNLVFHDG